ncbi:MAG: CNP1-like family protein [Nitrosomonas sp.]|nr:CNP1-like family protein [Nitrosomonas sp.]
MNGVNCLLPACVCLLLLSACAGRQEFVDTFDHGKTWEEIASGLPPYPQTGDLLMFDAGPVNNMRYFIDANSISVDKKQRLIRYSLIIRSPQGGDNVSYEALRCETRERKRYAIGDDATQTWESMRTSKWETLEQVRQLHAQRELSKYYFCPRGLVVNSAKEAIHALKAGIHPKAIR